jgi:signal transduction histidine kinase
MADLENHIFCPLDGLTLLAREQKRLTALKQLGLLEAELIPAFDQATEIAAQFLEAPICISSVLTRDVLFLKSAVGLSQMGLMNPLAQLRQLPRRESFCTYVVDARQVLAIPDTTKNPVFAESLLVSRYGIRAYLGAPLLSVDGQCLGALAVMDWVPRRFTSQDRAFLAMAARWSLSEFERDRLLPREQRVPNPWHSLECDREWESGEMMFGSVEPSNHASATSFSTNTLKTHVLAQLTQELRTPLTSVMGMASVLGREIYGPLTDKQKEYLEIIYRSGQHLVSLVDEIIALGLLDEARKKLNLAAIDLEMLCQQALNNLLEIAQQRQQTTRLSVEPGSRIGLLDKEKVRPMLYHLVYSILQIAEPGGEVRIHVSRKDSLEHHSLEVVQIAVWISHPWLGEGLPPIYGGIASTYLASVADMSDVSLTSAPASELEGGECNSHPTYLASERQILSSAGLWEDLMKSQHRDLTTGNPDDRAKLGLLLSCHLAELHRGYISIQGSPDLGYRYAINLPQVEPGEERL